MSGHGGTSHPTRLLVLGGVLVAMSPGVMLGWGFSLGLLAGCTVCCTLWWVNHD